MQTAITLFPGLRFHCSICGWFVRADTVVEVFENPGDKHMITEGVCNQHGLVTVTEE